MAEVIGVAGVEPAVEVAVAVVTVAAVWMEVTAVAVARVVEVVDWL